MGQPFTYENRNYNYSYDNDDNDYLLDIDIIHTKNSTSKKDIKESDASIAIEKLETLKREAELGKISHEDFMETQKKFLNDFNSRWGEFLFDTEYSERFYENLNQYFINKG